MSEIKFKAMHLTGHITNPFTLKEAFDEESYRCIGFTCFFRLFLL